MLCADAIDRTRCEKTSKMRCGVENEVWYRRRGVVSRVRYVCRRQRVVEEASSATARFVLASAVKASAARSCSHLNRKEEQTQSNE
jgi:hypothetical protein